MTHATRHLLVIATLATIALSATACGPATSSVTPSILASPSAAPRTGSTPSAPPSPSASTAPSGATACAVTPQTAALPSDRFTDLTVSSGTSSDRLTFVFGNGSLPGPASPPEGTLTVAPPPYTQAGSGAPIQMTGDHVIGVRFTGMSLQNDAGEETYTGPADVRPDLPALRDAVLSDASEGVVGWYVGYDGTGCVTLARVGDAITVTIDHS